MFKQRQCYVHCHDSAAGSCTAQAKFELKSTERAVYRRAQVHIFWANTDRASSLPTCSGPPFYCTQDAPNQAQSPLGDNSNLHRDREIVFCAWQQRVVAATQSADSSPLRVFRHRGGLSAPQPSIMHTRPWCTSRTPTAPASVPGVLCMKTKPTAIC